jgi:release factor glutamine methyltransferase
MKPSAYPKPSNPPSAQSLGDWLAAARQLLRALEDEPPSSLYALAAHILQRPAYWPQAHPEFQLNPEQLSTLDRQLQLLLSGHPLPYLLHNQSFYGLDFYVDPQVLIPRPETELLVETALAWLAQHPQTHLAADIGTGSGCIALSIAHHCQQVHFTATDFSLASLQIARRNRTSLALEERVDLLQCDLLSAVNVQFDLICANPPYIPSAKLPALAVAQHEPVSALDGGPDGLRLIERLLQQAVTRLKPGGLLLLEMEFSQSEAIQPLIRSYFPHARVTIKPDLNQLPRLAAVETGKSSA